MRERNNEEDWQEGRRAVVRGMPEEGGREGWRRRRERGSEEEDGEER